MAKDLVKTYQSGEIEVRALRGISFEIDAGQFVSFTGPSGSGKTTLLNLIGSLDIQTSGELIVAGQAVNQLDIRQRARFRGHNIGIIFQDFNLIPVLTVRENIEYPLLMVKPTPAAERSKIVSELMEQVGITEQADKLPSQISGGQKQRVAIARALSTAPKLVLADEPTANLDKATSTRIIDLMKELKNRLGTSFIFSTHDPRVVSHADVIFVLEDGQLQSSAAAQALIPGGEK
ncbi:MAG: ABC transporter ATP-binding protein [Candidatus Riflebacteria bacterium]|nr:ABC transporter ATP-binding protein [Candidatus Riflebacteria bacterium]